MTSYSRINFLNLLSTQNRQLFPGRDHRSTLFRTGQIEVRLKELAKEWDLERALETNAATLALSGVLLGAFHDKRWFILPGIVTTFLLQHGLQGWCPPLPLLRKLGLRTRKEIDEERSALKALRGDFNKVLSVTAPEGVLNVVRS